MFLGGGAKSRSGNHATAVFTWYVYASILFRFLPVPLQDGYKVINFRNFIMSTHRVRDRVRDRDRRWALATAAPNLGTLGPVRSLPGRRSLRSTGANQSSFGTTGQAINRRQPCWKALPEDLTSSQSELWTHLSPPAQNVAVQEVFFGHHRLILTASWLSA